MLDSLTKKIYMKFIKNKFKYFFTILLYFLYQIGFLPTLISELGFDLYKLPKPYKIFTLGLTDLVYIILVLIMFKKEIINGIKDLKKNLNSRINIATKCWLIGCIIMFTSSIVISLIVKKDVSTNEELVRESIKLAPLYMLFTCSIVAPIFEEMVFRISLNNIIKKKWLFIFLSGFTFGLLHVIGSYNNILDFLYVIPYGAMGSAFAYLLTKTKNITLPILVHMIHNTILVISQIIGG